MDHNYVVLVLVSTEPCILQEVKDAVQIANEIFKDFHRELTVEAIVDSAIILKEKNEEVIPVVKNDWDKKL